MSSTKPTKPNKTVDNYEPIPIETTILKINVKTTGDLLTKDHDLIPFHANMIDMTDLSNNSYIFFPSFVKITQKDLERIGAESDPSVFTKLDKYLKLMQYVTGNDKELPKEEDNTLLTHKSQTSDYAASLAQNSISDLMSDDVSDIIAIQKNEPLTDVEIITNNIELIRSLFFRAKGHFFILGNEYIIGESKYIPDYKASKEINKKLETETNKEIPLVYTIKIELQLLDAVNNPDAGDFIQMKCKDKKRNIGKDMTDLIGWDIGYVAETKAVIPSILNTSKATQNRNYGKLQKEWEERNKYVKPPANERERIEMINNMTPLQKKMYDYEQNQEVYKKIPPEWIKDRDGLENKYKIFNEEMLKVWQEMQDIKKSNEANPENEIVKELLDEERKKMMELIEPFIAAGASTETEAITNEDIRRQVDAMDEDATYIKKMKDYLLKYNALKKELEKKKTQTPPIKEDIVANYEKELNELAKKIVDLKSINDYISALENITDEREMETKLKTTDINDPTHFLYKAKKKEKDAIDTKYIAILAEKTGLEEKNADLKALQTEEKAIYAKIRNADPYNVAALKVDLSKMQERIRKKTSEIKLIENKFGKENLIKKWEDSLRKTKTLEDTIDTEKTREEKTTMNKSIKEEMKKTFEELQKLKKQLLIAKLKSGETADLTREEIKEFDKEDRPFDEFDTIEQKIKDLKKDYLNIAERLGGFYYKIQGEITLLVDDATRFSKLKSGKDKEKYEIDRDIREKNSDLSRLYREKQYAEARSSNAATARPPSSDDAALDERIVTLKAELVELTAKLNSITAKIKDYKTKYTTYNAYIIKLKALKDDRDLKTKYATLYNNVDYATVEKTLEVPSNTQSGGNRTYKKQRRHYKTKRKTKLIKRRKTIQKKRHRKRKYTLRRRRHLSA